MDYQLINSKEILENTLDFLQDGFDWDAQQRFDFLAAILCCNGN